MAVGRAQMDSSFPWLQLVLKALGALGKEIASRAAGTASAGLTPSFPHRLELCTFTLAVALGAVLLLPFSIISNEVLLSLPRNYYIQWLNGSLIHGMWLDQRLGWEAGRAIRRPGRQAASSGLSRHAPPVDRPLNDQLLFSFLALGLWNLVFLFSNLSLVFLMPFAYFFTESEGFAGSRKVSRACVSQP
jgi:hypothetical protein